MTLLVTMVNACLRDGRGSSPTAVLEEPSLTELERCRVPRHFRRITDRFAGRPRPRREIWSIPLYWPFPLPVACGRVAVMEPTAALAL